MKELNKIIAFLKKEKVEINYQNDEILTIINGIKITIDTQKLSFEVEGISFDRKNVFNLNKTKENYCTLMLLLRLFIAGYSPKNIVLEKSYQVGRDNKYLDVLIINPNNDELYMIEVKTLSEYKVFTKPENEKKVTQLFSYALQDRGTVLLSYYTYDFDNDTDHFSSVFCADLIANSSNADEFYDRWNKKFDNEPYYFNENPYGIKKMIKQYESLEPITEKDTKVLYLQFLTVLRLNSVSDKPNAFMKRLNSLYKEGMEKYMEMEVIDYDDVEIKKALGNQYIPELYKMFDDLRLKKNNEFAFIEVHDDKTFLENFDIVKQVVTLLENYKFKYETKHQFLADFFEDLLNTSLKQEAGQFFTPYPLVDFMIESLDIESRIRRNIEAGEKNIIPNFIDYACGAGHFLIAAMAKIQNSIEKLKEGSTNSQTKQINAVKEDPYSWATGDIALGIEKGKYFVVSAHREENINSDNFFKLVYTLNTIAETYKLPIIMSTHPRTRNMIKEKGVKFNPLIQTLKPLGFIDYNKLQIESKAVLSDSGTISEESSILKFKALNIREAHERPEAYEEASVMMVGLNKERILQGLKVLETQKPERLRHVEDYMMPNVADKVLRIIIGYTDYVNGVVWRK